MGVKRRYAIYGAKDMTVLILKIRIFFKNLELHLF